MENTDVIQESKHIEANERTFNQSELNAIVGRAKQEAIESFKRQQSQSSTPSSSGISESEIRRLAGEELKRQKDEWAKQAAETADIEAAKKIVETYRNKISAGKDKYQDFDQVTGSLDMRYYPNVVQLLAEHVDNSHDVLYDLARNRTKLHQLEATCAHNSRDAIYEIKRLADSIKANDLAASAKSAKTPLSQQRPSINGVDSTSSRPTMRELKFNKALRG